MVPAWLSGVISQSMLSRLHQCLSLYAHEQDIMQAWLLVLPEHMAAGLRTKSAPSASGFIDF